MSSTEEGRIESSAEVGYSHFALLTQRRHFLLFRDSRGHRILGRKFNGWMPSSFSFVTCDISTKHDMIIETNDVVRTVCCQQCWQGQYMLFNPGSSQGHHIRLSASTISICAFTPPYGDTYVSWQRTRSVMQLRFTCIFDIRLLQHKTKNIAEITASMRV